LKSLRKISKVKKLDIKEFNIFLFDSFEGLPEYDGSKDKNLAWSKGQFKRSLDSIKSIINKIAPEVNERTRFVKGFYENTLTDDLRQSLIAHPPSLVNIDVDYYKSAKTVIEWIYPTCQDGTIFYFDDIFEYLGNLSKGEYKAIEEFNRNHLGEGFQFYPFYNFGIPSFTGRIFTLNKIVNECD
jgi:O-methyltransferase